MSLTSIQCHVIIVLTYYAYDHNIIMAYMALIVIQFAIWHSVNTSGFQIASSNQGL